MMLPSIAVMEVTAQCNHRCFFCSCPWEHPLKSPVREMSTDEWKQIITRYKFYGVTEMTFTGGEATMREDLPDLIRFAHGAGYDLSLVTNGRNITENLLNVLKENKVLLSISVPGIETFHEHTGTDNIDGVLALFRTCKDIGIKTFANIAVTKKNLTELYENIAYPLLNGADYVLLNRFLPGGRGMRNTEYLLSIDEINEMLDVAEKILTKAGVNGHIGTEVPYCIVKRPESYNRLDIGYKCGAAKSFFVTDPEGYVKVCNHSPHKVCHWSEIDGLEENEYWQRFRKSDYIPQMCAGCEHLDKCEGGCREAAHVYHGKIDDPDPCFMSIGTDP